MFKKLHPVLLLFLMINLSCISQEVSLHSLLKEMINVQAVASWPDPAYTLKQASSYDRRSVSPDKPGWFANADQAQFIRIEQIGNHKEYVMFDADGPGTIVRFWLTTAEKKERCVSILIMNPPLLLKYLLLI